MKKISLIMGFGSLLSLVVFIGCSNILQLLDVPVASVSVTPSSQTIHVGDTVTLNALVQPSNATNKTVVWSSDDQSVATVTSTGIVRGVGVGSATITATTADGAKTAIATISVVSVPIAVDGVTLNRSNVSLLVGGTYPLTATLSPSYADDQAVTWMSSNPNIVSVTSSGLSATIQGIGAGSATITVTTHDGGKIATCAVTVSQSTVPVQAVSLNFTSATLNVDGTLQLQAYISPSDATNQNVTWSTNAPAIANVSSTGLVTGVAPGSALITVTTADSTKTATCTVTVQSNSVAVTGVTLNRTTLSLEVGATSQLAATIVPQGATNQNITWLSIDPSVATVDTAGTVTGVAVGTTTVIVTTADGGYTATCAVTVTEPPAQAVLATSISLNQSLATITEGGTTQLTATILPTNTTNQNVTWSTSDPSLATVSASGLVTGVAAGRATITATTTDTTNLSATCTVTVQTASVAVAGVTLSQSTAGIEVGGTVQLAASIAPSDATNQNVSWSSGAEAVATVSSTGLVTGVAAGTAVITVKTADGGYTATCTVTVTEPPPQTILVTDLTLNQSVATITAGGTTQLAATILPTNASNQTLTWISSAPTIATVSSTGLVTGIAAGTATIKASTTDGSNISATCSVTVTTASVAVTGVTLNQTSTTIEVGTTFQLAATIAPSNATNQNVTWATSDPTIAAVTSTGTVSGVAPGSATITVKTADGGFTADCLVTVTAATVSVTGVSVSPATLSLVAGGTYQLAATITPSDATNQRVSWSTSDKTIATVSSTGLVTAIAQGTANIMVTTADGGHTDTCAVTVAPKPVAVTGVTLDLHSNSINVTDSFQLTATVSPSDATNPSVSWSSSDKTVATVSSTGLVTGIAAGSATIKVTTVDGSFTDTCTVTVKAVTYSLTVKANPTAGGKASAAATTVVAGVATSITATAYPGYAFNGWSLVTGSGVKFGNAASATTTVTLTTGDATIQANFEPIGAFAYVTFAGSDVVWSYTVGASTGTLRDVAGTPYLKTGQTPSSVIEVLAGGDLPVLYVANSGSSDISAFQINQSTGELKPVSGSPFPLKGRSPMALAADPGGHYLYSANAASNDIDAFKIDPSTGALSLSGEFAAQGTPWAVTTHPNGYLYVTNRGTNNISAFTIDPSSGKLSEIKGSPFAAGKAPTEAVIDPKGVFLYAVNSGEASIYSYKIDATTGALSLANKNATKGNLPVSVTTDSTGEFVYAADNYGGFDANVFGFISKSGALGPISGSPFKNVVGAYSVRRGPSGTFLFVADRESNAVTVYTIEPTTGVLKMVGDSPFKTNPSGPNSIATVAKK